MKEPLPKFILIGFRTLDLNDLVDISFYTILTQFIGGTVRLNPEGRTGAFHVFMGI